MLELSVWLSLKMMGYHLASGSFKWGSKKIYCFISSPIILYVFFMQRFFKGY
jgi:hypothetical protein